MFWGPRMILDTHWKKILFQKSCMVFHYPRRIPPGMVKKIPYFSPSFFAPFPKFLHCSSLSFFVPFNGNSQSFHFERKSKNDTSITSPWKWKVKWSALVFCKGNGHPCVATVEMKVRVKVGTGRKIGLLPFSRFCATPPPRAMVSLPNLRNISLFPGCTFLLTLIGFQYFYSVVCH